MSRRRAACWRASRCMDFKASAFDGSYHEVDSSEMAFKIAGSMAWKEANRAAGPILLEPIMKVEVTTPKEYMGAINGDLSRRRGAIHATEEAPGGAPSHYRARPAFGDVRLCDRHAVGDARPGDLHDGVRALRKGAAQRRGRDRCQSGGEETCPGLERLGRPLTAAIGADNIPWRLCPHAEGVRVRSSG